MKTKILLILLFLFQLNSIAQPTIQWQKSLGGSGRDYGRVIQQTVDGGYIVVGESGSTNGNVTGNHGYIDYWIVKLNSARNIQWQKSLGGSDDDRAYAIQQTTDGGYIIAGESGSTDGDVTGNHGGLDYWIVRLDSVGKIRWQKSLGGSDDIEYAYAVQQTTDGGYIVAGASKSTDGDVTGNHGRKDYWTVKLDSTGNIQWQKSLGGSDNENAYSIIQTIDGGYIVAGDTWSNDGDVTGNHGAQDCWIVKLDGTGNIQWQKSLGGSDNENAYSIIKTTDGGYIVAGGSYSTDGDVTGNHGDIDYWIVKLDSAGNIQWQKSFGGSTIDVASAIQQTTDGGYIVSGDAFSTNGDVTGHHGASYSDHWIVKLDDSGTIHWQKCLGGSYVDFANSIQETSDGGFIIAGSSESIDGDVTGNHGDYDYWIVKLNPNVGIEEQSGVAGFTIYPNPFSNKFTLSFSKPMSNASLKIFNMMGEEAYEQTVNGKQETVNTNLSSGIYFVQVREKERQWVEKIVVE